MRGRERERERWAVVAPSVMQCVRVTIDTIFLSFTFIHRTRRASMGHRLREKGIDERRREKMRRRMRSGKKAAAATADSDTGYAAAAAAVA